MRLLLLFSFLIPLCAPATPGDTLHLYFDFGKSNIKPQYNVFLDTLIRRTPTGHYFLINGYADARGTTEKNKLVSERRAVEVRTYLIRKGVDSSRIYDCKGFGTVGAAKDSNAADRRVDLVASAVLPLRLTMGNLKVGDVFELSDVLFLTGTHSILDSSFAALDELSAVMYDEPALKIQLEGHVCCYEGSWAQKHGLSDLANSYTGTYTLSTDRAKAVCDYLIRTGIAKERISYKGFGGKNPKRDPEVSQLDRDINKRVQVRIIAR